LASEVSLANREYLGPKLVEIANELHELAQEAKGSQLPVIATKAEHERNVTQLLCLCISHSVTVLQNFPMEEDDAQRVRFDGSAFLARRASIDAVQQLRTLSQNVKQDRL